jgi:hypothetical protein
MKSKIFYFAAALALFILGFYEAYQQQFMYMWALFIAMGICLGIALRGRNTWMM